MFGWRRNSQTRRIERIPAVTPRPPPTTPNFGHNFVLTMYKTLFPYINVDNRSLDKVQNADLLNNCFENGAFVFKDAGRVLFNYLMNGTQDVWSAKKPGDMHAKTHLIPRKIWKKQSQWRDNIRRHYDDINFIFYGREEKKTEVNMRKYTFGMGSRFNNRDIKQYELKISPPIKYLCNPECDNSGNGLDYCGHGKYQGYDNGQRVGLKPGPGKKVMKFYCYSLEYKKNGKVVLSEGPFTYIKLESKALTRAAGGNLLNIAHHFSRNKTKNSTRNKEGPKANRMMAEGKCWRFLSNSAYCYRAEDYGWVDEEHHGGPPRMNIKRFDVSYNYFPNTGLTNNDKREIKEYALNADGRQLDNFKLRTGFELYVPQTLTTWLHRRLLTMSQQVNFSANDPVEVYWDGDDQWYRAHIQRGAHDDNPDTLRVKYEDNDDNFTSGLLYSSAPKNTEIRHRLRRNDRDDRGAYETEGGHRKRTRKRRRKTRKRRRTKRHKRKYRRKRTRRTRKKKN